MEEPGVQVRLLDHVDLPAYTTLVAYPLLRLLSYILFLLVILLSLIARHNINLYFIPVNFLFYPPTSRFTFTYSRPNQIC